jgi:hypothetical protein
LVAARFDRVLRRAMKLDEPIDVRPTTAARAACTAGFPHLVTASCARIDASPNRVVVDRMAVANQHDSINNSGNLQIKFNNAASEKSNDFDT